MSEKGNEIYQQIKEKIGRLTERGTQEKQFLDFWRIACETKQQLFDQRHSYDDSSREFISKHKEHLIQIREEFIENMDYYVDKCIDRMQKTSHFRVYYAKTNAEAQKLFLEELGDAKVIYKSHSGEAKDIGIVSALKKHNIQVVETSIGTTLTQLFNYQLPAYQLGPSIHFSAKEIAAKMKEVYGVDVEPRAETIIQYYREHFRPELLTNVTVSLTSANAIAADEGSLVLVEGSGNISLITRATEKHMVAVGITKIVPTISDAFLVARTQARAPNVSMSYISIITAPSGTSPVAPSRILPS